MTNGSHSALAIVYQPLDALKTYAKNPRTHSKVQIRKIAESIRTFGFTTPVLIDGNNTIIAGHGRVAAARLLEIAQVPTIRLESLTDDQVRAYVIADNRLAERAGWDKAILAIELQNLIAIDADFDVTITGFEVPEIDLILQEANEEKPDKDDLFQIDDTDQSVSQSGDIWVLGKHRILCGSSIEKSSYNALMGSRRANEFLLIRLLTCRSEATSPDTALSTIANLRWLPER